jgi:maleate isomerase
VTIDLLHGTGVLPIFTRVPKRGAVDPHPDAYDLDAMLEAATLLADARPDAIVWNASKGGVIGFEHDRDLVVRITAATGVPADTSALALMRALAKLDARRVAIVGPHEDAYNRRAAARLAGEGFETVWTEGLGITDNLAFADVPEAAMDALIRRAAATRPGAVVVWNTNCHAAPLLPTLEAELGVAVLDATVLGVLAGLRLIERGGGT